MTRARVRSDRVTVTPVREPTADRLGPVDGISIAIAVLMTALSLRGLVDGGPYRDNTWSTAAFRGTDAATLFVAVPTLLVSLWLARRGSVPGRLVWLGMIFYSAYDYAFYVFGTAFNDLFLGYCAVLACSVVVLVLGMPRVLAVADLAPGAPRRFVGGFLALVGVMFGLVWIVQAVAYVVTGDLPQAVVDSGIHTNVVFALDLSFVVPWLVISGVKVWRGGVGSAALAVGLTSFATVYMVALAVAGQFMANAGIPLNPGAQVPPEPETARRGRLLRCPLCVSVANSVVEMHRFRRAVPG